MAGRSSSLAVESPILIIEGLRRATLLFLLFGSGADEQGAELDIGSHAAAVDFGRRMDCSLALVVAVAVVVEVVVGVV